MRRKPRGQDIAVLLQTRLSSAMGKSISWVRPCATPSCSAGEVVKVRNWCALATTLDQLARARHPAHFPAGQRKDLAGRTDAHTTARACPARSRAEYAACRHRRDAHRPRRRSRPPRSPAPPAPASRVRRGSNTRPTGLSGELIRIGAGLRRDRGAQVPLLPVASRAA